MWGIARPFKTCIAGPDTPSDNARAEATAANDRMPGRHIRGLNDVSRQAPQMQMAERVKVKLDFARNSLLPQQQTRRRA
jgi:hypothetical protein